MSLKNIRTVVFALLLILALGSSQSRAGIYHGNLETPKTLVERGFWMGPDFGMLFTINNSTSVSSLGFITGVTLGYDIIKYLSIIGMADFAIFEAGPDIQGGMNMFFLNGGLKGSYPVSERFYPFMRFMGGGFFTDPNLKDSTAVDGSGNPLFADVPTSTFDMWIGAGFTYYMHKRHFSFDLAFDYVYIHNYPLDALNLSGSLRYTF